MRGRGIARLPVVPAALRAWLPSLLPPLPEDGTPHPCQRSVTTEMVWVPLGTMTLRVWLQAAPGTTWGLGPPSVQAVAVEGAAVLAHDADADRGGARHTAASAPEPPPPPPPAPQSTLASEWDTLLGIPNMEAAMPQQPQSASPTSSSSSLPPLDDVRAVEVRAVFAHGTARLLLDVAAHVTANDTVWLDWLRIQVPVRVLAAPGTPPLAIPIVPLLPLPS
jgi:hypothetical protein